MTHADSVVLLMDFRTVCCSWNTFPWRKTWFSCSCPKSLVLVDFEGGTSNCPRRILALPPIAKVLFVREILSYRRLGDPCGSVRRSQSYQDGSLCHTDACWICSTVPLPFVPRRSYRSGCIWHHRWRSSFGKFLRPRNSKTCPLRYCATLTVKGSMGGEII